MTKPTDDMREAMRHAEVGDDVYGEDPAVNELEAYAAELLGKEAALFVTSGTQGNQAAILTHTRPGEEIILESESHVFYYEAGAAAAFAGVQMRTIPGTRGQMPLAHVRQAIRTRDIHFPRTGLILLENTHNRAGGAVLPLDYMQKMHALSRECSVPIHLDGARLFNAAVTLGVPVKAITQYVDTVQICLSKGLCAPVGSILAGPAEWIERASVWRKRLGGGMRQAGVIAAPGLIALKEMPRRLAEDHRHARMLAEGLSALEGIAVDADRVDTNIVVADIRSLGVTTAQFLPLLQERGVRCTSFGTHTVRLVTHREITSSDIEHVIAAFAEAVQSLRVEV